MVTTHQVEEIEHILTDLMFIDAAASCFVAAWKRSGRASRGDGRPEQAPPRAALKPMHERQVFGRSMLLFDGVPRQQLAALGEVRTPSIADLFVATMKGATHEPHVTLLKREYWEHRGGFLWAPVCGGGRRCW